MPHNSNILSTSHILHRRINLIMPFRLPWHRYYWAHNNVHLNSSIYPVLGLIGIPLLTVIFKTKKKSYNTKNYYSWPETHKIQDIAPILLRHMIKLKWFTESTHYHRINWLTTDNNNII